jgi:mRNA interferase RelE/StbE
LAWTVEISDIAERQIKKLDFPIQKRVLDWLNERIEGCKNPRHFGEPLKGEYSGFWRYRIGDFRIICDIQDSILVVLVLTIGHRRRIYKRGKQTVGAKRRK